ncbi:hypothetical protein, partial [Haloferula sp. A504]|uniref:hypothetical protein n=1 Tax=Haloferula sp. A504 TaxID=3373601 RepID=UPI0031BEF93E|nr:hypothetical protein [Verrucomicrobiaceae bacterium E54]
TLLELTVVILVLLALIAVLFIGGRAWKRGSDRASCIMNIRNVQQAVRSHQNLNGVPDNAPIDIVTDLVGGDNFLRTEPVCPAGGTYSMVSAIPELGTLAIECSLATSEDHVPSFYAGW